MKRVFCLALALVLGTILATQLMAGERPQGRNSGLSKQFQPSGGNGGNGGQLRSGNFNPNFNPNFSKPSGIKLDGIKVAPRVDKPKFDVKPIGPIVNKTPKFPQNPILVDKTPKFPVKPIGPIVDKPKFPIKPIGPIDVVDKTPKFPIKPIGPIVGKPGFPIKPIDPGIGNGKPIDPGFGNGKPVVKPFPIKPFPKCPPKCHDWWWGCYPQFVGGHCHTETIIIEVPTVVIVNEVPVVEVVKRQEVRVGSTIVLPGNFGPDQGGMMVQVNGISLGAIVNEWQPGQITVTLPMMGLERPMEAELAVFFPDGTPALKVPVLLLAAAPVETSLEAP